MNAPLQVGSQVRIRPEWRDAGDEHLTFTVIELLGDRLLVEPSGFEDWAVRPQSVVLVSMVEAAVLNVQEDSPC